MCSYALPIEGSNISTLTRPQKSSCPEKESTNYQLPKTHDQVFMQVFLYWDYYQHEFLLLGKLLEYCWIIKIWLHPLIIVDTLRARLIHRLLTDISHSFGLRSRLFYQQVKDIKGVRSEYLSASKQLRNLGHYISKSS